MIKMTVKRNGGEWEGCRKIGFSHKRKKNSKRQYGNGIHSALELPSTPLCRSPNAARALHHLKNLFDTLST